MKSQSSLSRRNFIKVSGLTGAALSLGIYFPTKAETETIITKEAAENLGIELNAWITIDTSGKVTIVNHRAEMGQGSFQSVPQIIAEELEVDLNQINIVFGVGNSKKYGSQITGGSSTIRANYNKLLRLSASARQMLIKAAANTWGVPETECRAENGAVIHSSGKKLHYGELVQEASKLTPPTHVDLKDPKDYKILRKPLPRQDTPLKVNGKAVFGLDKKLPGMLYAVVERNPRFLGKVKSFDDTAAKAVPGVKHVLKTQMNVFSHKREGVAVVADSIWSALQGRKALKVEWDDSGFEHHSSEQLYSKLNESLKGKPINFKSKGDFTDVFANSAKKLEAVYETPYESHSCMEPLTCTADVKDNKCDIWGPIQAPDWIQEDLSQQLNIPKENVTVNMTFLGGGFGRKAFTDYPHEAAMLSKELKVPIQVMWTREDDMTQGPFRPGMLYQCRAALNEGGQIEGFETLMAGQNMGHQDSWSNKKSYNNSVTEGFLETYLDSLPHYSFGDFPLDSPVPVMWWRSVYSSTNGFAFESFMDELAIAAGKDPLDFRKQHIWDDRVHSLIAKLEEVTKWKSREKNSGYGVAITECFSTFVGEVVKVSKKADGKIKIDKVWAVMDCGWYVNPDIIKAQIEGSIIMALGAATKHETLFKEGKAVQRNFDSYKMPRISEIPEIEVHIMENEEKAGGVGEPSLPPFSPALTNAIFDLTGKRIRRLPFDLDVV
ncbi:MAG TPA: xanthine dehydrogenase family protein molybdopterin-binding subunit [Chryseosolibacter sp.]